MDPRILRTAIFVVAFGALGSLALRVGTSESSSVAFRDPTAWLENGSTGDVMKVNATTGDVMAVVSVGSPGEVLDVVQVGPGAVVINRSVGEFSRLDGSLLEQTHVTGVDTGDLSQFVIEGSRSFLVESDIAQLVDPSTLAVLAEAEVGSPRTPVVDADGALWFVDGERGSLRRFEADEVDTRSEPLEDPMLASVVTVRGEVYLLQADLGVVNRVAGSSLVEASCIGENAATFTSGTPIGASTALAISVDASTGTLHLADIESGGCGTTELADGPRNLGPATELGGYVFVPDFDAPAVHIVEAETGRLVRTISLDGLVPTGSEFELISKDGIMWFNDPMSASAGVMNANRVLRTIQKSSGSTAAPGVGLEVPGGGGNEIVGSTDDPTAEVGPSAVVAGVEAIAGGTGEGTENSASPDSQQLLEEIPFVATGVVEQTDRLVADFTFSAATVAVGEVVFFTDASTGGPTHWEWDFTDGSVATGPEVSHSWDSPGLWVVRLDIENGSASASTETTIEVVDPSELGPQADFDFSDSTVEVAESVTFTSTSMGNPTGLQWDFGDGVTASGEVVEHQWLAAGQYVVTLVASNELGSTTSQATITVVTQIQRPVSVPIALPTSVLVGQSVFFSNASTGEPTRFVWDFGDRTTGRGSEIRHAFAAAGTYDVKLTVSNSLGQDTKSVRVVVAEALLVPDARFTSSVDGAEVGQPVVFTSTSTNSPNSIVWDFGDGTTATGAVVTKTWSVAAVYNVTLTVSSSAGSDKATKAIRVAAKIPAPTAAFVFSPTTVFAGQSVLFSDTSTGGAASTWSWKWGDDTPAATIAKPTHVFESAGTYAVTLVVGNAAGSSSVVRTVTVVPRPPIAAIGFSPSAPAEGADVAFVDTSSGGAATSWLWTFDDQTPPSTAQNPTHKFAAAGNYVVTLTVENAGGSSSTAITVAVQPPPPVPKFAVGAPVVGVPVTFTNTTTGVAPISYLWDFGDGTPTSTAAAPTHTFAVAGPVTVTLRATDAGGSATLTKNLVVANPQAPTASFTSTATTINQGGSVTFTNTSTGATSLSWTFAGGTPGSSTAPNPTIVWTTPGTYIAKLTASNVGGSTSESRTITVVAVPDPVAAFTFASAGGTSAKFTPSTTCPTCSYAWTFSAGTPPSSTGVTPTASWSTAGTHNVAVTVCNVIAVCDNASATVTIIGPSGPGFSETTNLLNVSFTSAFVGCGPCTYDWNFGEPGATSSAANPSHTYLASGTYTVSLTVTGPVNSSTVSHDVTVVE